MLQMLLRIFGCLFAASFAFLVCMLIAGQVVWPPLADAFGGNLGMVISLSVGGAFGWAFWKWPGKKRP